MEKNNMTTVMVMDRNKRAVGCLLCCLLALTAMAQDPFPGSLKPETAWKQQRETRMNEGPKQLDHILVTDSLPTTFKNRKPNRIEREEQLFPLFEKLCLQHQQMRIVHIGDSHVRGHVFTVAARHSLEHAFGSGAVYPDSITYQTSALARETGRPGLIYHALGINGATTVQFTEAEHLDEVARLKPDLIILSFGTNESHGKRYSAEEHLTQLDALLTLLYKQCPGAVVMLTTPPGSYIRVQRRRKVVNNLTATVVANILDFAKQRGLPVWDLYDIAGGKQSACVNWVSGDYMQNDHVHFTHDGYILQGSLLAAAILNAYNDYVDAN